MTDEEAVDKLERNLGLRHVECKTVDEFVYEITNPGFSRYSRYFANGVFHAGKNEFGCLVYTMSPILLNPSNGSQHHAQHLLVAHKITATARGETTSEDAMFYNSLKPHDDAS